MPSLLRKLGLIFLLCGLLAVFSCGLYAQETEDKNEPPLPEVPVEKQEAEPAADVVPPDPAEEKALGQEPGDKPDEAQAIDTQGFPPDALPPQKPEPLRLKLAPNEEISPSGMIIKTVEKPQKRLLFINPELDFGGVLGDYRSLGGFLWWQFGGGVGFTLLEDWHFRATVRSFRLLHRYTHLPKPYFPAPFYGKEQDYACWFVQPTIYAMYRLGHYEKWHYFVPMDLFIGPKIGMNFLTKSDFLPAVKKKIDFNYGIAFLWRLYFHQTEKWRIGAAPYVEISTVNYFKDFFVTYGVNVFWDFEILKESE